MARNRKYSRRRVSERGVGTRSPEAANRWQAAYGVPEPEGVTGAPQGVSPFEAAQRVAWATMKDFEMRVRSMSDGTKVKIWPAGQAEPKGWSDREKIERLQSYMGPVSDEGNAADGMCVGVESPYVTETGSYERHGAIMDEVAHFAAAGYEPVFPYELSDGMWDSAQSDPAADIRAWKEHYWAAETPEGNALAEEEMRRQLHAYLEMQRGLYGDNR